MKRVPSVSTHSRADGTQAAELYRLYPRHSKRAAALRAIAKALRSESYETLRAATAEYAAAVALWPAADRPQYVPHPATWYNGECWLDDRATWVRASGKPATRSMPVPADAELMARVQTKHV